MPVRARWRGLELPVQVKINRATLTDRYAEFSVEPFERGFGHTIGNSLRRVLLSSLEGDAVVAVNINGVQQEFSAIKGVREDVAEIVLNIKEIVLRLHSHEERSLTLEAHKKGEVKLGDMTPDPAVEVINPEHKIATLTEDVDFVCELIMRKGRGYVPAEEHEGLPRIIGIIPVDALFSPVQRVAYGVEDTRVGRNINYDRLVLQIWTNGVVTPEMALVEASKILRKHFNPFVKYFEAGRLLPPEQPQSLVPGKDMDHPEVTESTLSLPLKALGLSARALHCLEGEGMRTVRQLLERSEDDLLLIRNFGKVTLDELREKLAEHELEIGLLAPED